MAPAVVRLDPDTLDDDGLRAAARVLRHGGVVAFPPETFYGLGAAALDHAAVRRVFEIKGRPSSMPLLVLIDDVRRVSEIAAEVPAHARRLMQRYWPGPLTLVFRAASQVPSEVTAGTGTIGVRVPGHHVARALISHVGGPVTAPSANRTGAAPPTTAAGVLEQLGDGVDLVLDAGPTPGGAPSTVLDVTVDPPRVIRQGAIRLGF